MATKKQTKPARKPEPVKRVSRGQKAAELVVHADDRTLEKEIESATVPVLVDFSATWCGPCQRLAEALPTIAQKFAGRVKFVKVDVDESPKSAARHGAEAVPLLVLFDRGKPVAKEAGFGGASATEAWLEAALKKTTKQAVKKPRGPTCRCK